MVRTPPRWKASCGLAFFVAMQTVLAQAEATETFTSTFCTGPISVPIEDDAYAGTLGSMAQSTLTIASAGPIAGIEVTGLALSHSWVGDLTIKLESPSTTLVTLLNRPGGAAPDTGADSPVGDSSNIQAAFPISFSDLAPQSAELMGGTLPDTGVICRDDTFCSYVPAPDTAPPSSLGDFIGEDTAGTWTLYVGDSAFLDTGNLQQWCLTIEYAGPDSDGDGIPDGTDCRPADLTLWSAPTEARNLMLTRSGGSVDLSWMAPASPGGTGATLYDVLRSTDPADFIDISHTTCVATGITGTSTAEGTPAGSVFYLVRARNACGGSLGSRSDGTPRAGRSCP